MRKTITLFAVISLLAGCALLPPMDYSGRAYNLATGEVLPFAAHANLKGQAVLTAGPSSSGETFSGESQSIDNATRTKTRGTYQGFNTFVSGSSYSVSRPGYQNGAAVLVGDKGTVIDVVYQVTYHGTGEGEGQDNKGNHYRIMFQAAK